ncbi:winged helix-turn-helix transcriptional regulator [Saccharothrix sp. 6-C]|uniref:winged helix-turn-helix domain-containing protein n=1 Tax=Saccharothrix sp. 6-C TaxID=2781735 RepID=UPI001916E676|nr:winged helix-turn-helix domain-containing protein [Saccharothrix sp. 6-C]QQQ80130.1 winged helix-turn-helix transcriptional regulator [Saccharothrix sp. 6-C]
MTADERTAFDADPLWTSEGQVLWLLTGRTDEPALLSVAEVAQRLELSQPEVSYALQRLSDQGVVLASNAGRHQVWGTPEHVARLRVAREREERRIAAEKAAQRKSILDDNKELEAIAAEMRQILAGQGLSASLHGQFSLDAEEPRKNAIFIAVDDPAAARWLLGRLRRRAPEEDVPTSEQWDEHLNHLEQLLQRLSWAGWSEDETGPWCEHDEDTGPVVYVTLHRTWMAFDVEYYPAEHLLKFLPHEYAGGWPQIFSVLDDEVVIRLTGTPEAQVEQVSREAGALGLLDATRVEVDEDADVSLRQVMDVLYTEWIFEEASRYREMPVLEVAAEMEKDPYLNLYFDTVVAMLGGDVLPDLVPDAAARGIAAWCWRNDTAVEAHHVADDVLMARINIAVTRVVEQHVDPFEGVDWAALKSALTDPSWGLPDGRAVSELFGKGWPEVRETVAKRLDDWRRVDEQVIGPEATLRLLTIGGSTDHTCHWWGQGRWEAICRAVVTDATAAGISLPPPYDDLGAEKFLADLVDPDNVDDTALDWLIDLPSTSVDGPRGLRFHAATRPITRIIEPVNWPVADVPTT